MDIKLRAGDVAVKNTKNDLKLWPADDGTLMKFFDKVSALSAKPARVVAVAIGVLLCMFAAALLLFEACSQIDRWIDRVPEFQNGTYLVTAEPSKTQVPEEERQACHEHFGELMWSRKMSCVNRERTDTQNSITCAAPNGTRFNATVVRLKGQTWESPPIGNDHFSFVDPGSTDHHTCNVELFFNPLPSPGEP